MTNPNHELASVISEFDGEYDTSPSTSTQSLTLSYESLVKLALLTGSIYLFYFHLNLFQPYLTSLMLAFFLSFPVRYVKSHLVGYFDMELSTRPIESTLSFLFYCFVKATGQILVGSYVTNLALTNLEFYLNLGQPAPQHINQANKSSPTIKVEGKNLELPNQLNESNGVSVKGEEGLFGKLSAKQPSSSLGTSTSDYQPRTDAIDELCGTLNTEDWWYVIQSIRLTFIYLGLAFLYHYSLMFAIIISTTITLYWATVKYQPFPQTAKDGFKTATQKAGFGLRFINRKICEYIRSDLGSFLTTILCLSLTFGLLYSGYKLISLAVYEIIFNTVYLATSSIRFAQFELVRIISALSTDQPHIITQYLPATQYVEDWIKEQNHLSYTLTEAAEYLRSDLFTSFLEDTAPTLSQFVQNNPSSANLFDMSNLSTLVQEFKSVASVLLDHLKLEIPDFGNYSAMAGPLVGTLFGSLAGVSIKLLLVFFDFIFQIVVFLTTLSLLVGRPDSPLTPLNHLTHTTFSSSIIHSIEHLINSIWLSTFQMGLYHTLISLVTFHLFNAPQPFYFTFISTFLAIVPLGGPYLAASTPCFYMWYFQGRTLSSILLFFIHFMASNLADSHFYNNTKPLNPFYFTLSVFLAVLSMGAAGVMLGPLLLAIIPTAYTLITDPLNFQSDLSLYTKDKDH